MGFLKLRVYCTSGIFQQHFTFKTLFFLIWKISILKDSFISYLTTSGLVFPVQYFQYFSTTFDVQNFDFFLISNFQFLYRRIISVLLFINQFHYFSTTLYFQNFVLCKIFAKFAKFQCFTMNSVIFSITSRLVLPAQYFFGLVLWNLDLSKISICKGQIISEQNCGVLNFPKMQRNIARISALATKMVQIRKIKAHYHANQ